jgi:uncharacterized RDD family membrane protein YckC
MEEQEISIFPEIRIVYATFGQRLGAAILDGLILLIPGIVLKVITGGKNFTVELFWYHEFDSRGFIAFLLEIIVDWLYFALMESSMAQATIGKQALGIMVTSVNGERISFARATGRYFSKNISVLIIFLGYFMMLWDEKNQTLHDKIAGTLVVKKSPQF